MTITLNIHEAKTHLSRLLKRVMNGEEVVIARAGMPVAILSPYSPAPEPRKPGDDSGQVVIATDFDAPLPEFEQV